MIAKLLRRLEAEPVAVGAFTQAAIGLVVAFGAHLSGQQIGAIMAAEAAVVGMLVRSQVTPSTNVTAPTSPTK